jgi:hypothetical protein
MLQFEKWTLETIRSEGTGFNWLEEFRFDWTTITAQSLQSVLAGKTIVLITDYEREWFATYITTHLNRLSNDRPMIPIVSLEKVFPDYDRVVGGEMIDVLDDMLELSYKGDYFFWYVGRGGDKRADIAKRSSESYLWIMDEDFQNAIKLRSYDKSIDIKLIQLYQLFNATLNAMLFGEISISDDTI